MTREEIEAKVRTIVSEHLNVGLERVTPDGRLIEDMGADSLDQVELVMSAEEEFGVEISDSDCADMVTVNDVVNWLVGHQLIILPHPTSA